MTTKNKLQAIMLVGTLACSTASMAVPVELMSNGDFSSGLAGWTVTNSGSGNWFADTVGTTTPVSGHTTSALGGGAGTYAVSDQGGPGTHALTQAFTAIGGSTIVSFDMFANDSDGGPIINPAGLTHTAGPNQHVRVDILAAGAGAFSTLATDIVTTLIAPMVDPQANNPNPFSNYLFDISSFVSTGTTYQLRFAEVDTNLFLNMGVDNVSVSSQAVPEPSIVWLLGSGLALVGLVRRKART